MRKISPETVNRLIDSIKTENDDRIKIPRTPTYRENVYLDYDKFIDSQEEIEDLMRQTLPFFSKDPDKYFPCAYYMCTGERNSNGGFKSWTQNRDDVTRLLLLAMYSGIVSLPKKIIEKNTKGEDTEFLAHCVLKRLKPVIVRQSSGQ